MTVGRTHPLTLDALLSLAAQYETHTRLTRFKTCLLASRVVGHYEAGATNRMAAALRCSPDTIERYARTGGMYSWLVGYARRLKTEPERVLYFRTLREARQQLGYLWFESLKIYYYAEDPRAALEQLRTALDTDITLDEFRRHIQPARQAEWEWAVEQIGRAVAVLQKEHYGMPDELRVKARAVRVLMSANGEKPGLTAIARVISMNSI